MILRRLGLHLLVVTRKQELEVHLPDIPLLSALGFQLEGEK